MTNATVPDAPAATTIRPEEAAHFGAMAADWWDPHGSSAMLHRVNPVRLRFIRDAIDAHWKGAGPDARPLAGKRALDVGCGAGLLCEPLARLGAEVVGIDAAPQNIEIARAHADAMGLADKISYFHGDLGSLDPGKFDLVTSMEVIEHVADKQAFVRTMADALAPDGLMVLSTPNRTPQSRLLLVEAAERMGMVPRGTHDWNDFLTPEELRALLGQTGLAMGEPRGIGWSPGKRLHLSSDLALNYIVTVRRTLDTADKRNG